MTYTLEQLATDIHSTLKAQPGTGGMQTVCQHVSKALNDEDFVTRHMPDRAPDADPREILFEDPELGFCICAHVYGDAAFGDPHDHGAGWAIYGQATGSTEMTDWRIVEKGNGEEPTLVEPEKTYTLVPGDVHFYDVGAVHSPKRDAPTKLLRVEGTNLDNVERSNIKEK
jgi:predicted metal-dependent enzyme (double-stranded beta helix superfamily)